MPRKGEKSATSQSDAEMTDSVMEMTESDETLVHRYGLNVFDEQDPTERRKIREQYRELIERAQREDTE